MSEAARRYRWGPSLTSGGGTGFRLWAPSEENLSLKIGDRKLPMKAAENGWFEIEIGARPLGQPYGFVLSDGTIVPDPASRYQVDVLGLSTLVNPTSFQWHDAHWKGRRWEEAIFYELHVGTFTLEGTFRGALERLAYLADIGFTAVEVMPIAQFPGERGWGYDGVFHYAPFSHYGSPDDFKAFVDAAHGHGLMVFLDVVYNHFGPIGNFLSRYAPNFFLEDNPTPWGPRIAFANEAVRRFFIENAVYWLTEFHLDGLRLDAVDMIDDPSDTHILEDLSVEAYASVRDRHIHLITENPANGTDLMALRPDGTRLFKADWNDDFHHALHVAVTGETTGHYALSDSPWEKTATALATGYLMEGRQILGIEPPRPASLPTTCFVHFLQNHDQVGNRALGDRLHMNLGLDLYAALVEVLVLSPHVPLFFIGDDHLSTQPFRFFADYEGELRNDVWENRETEARNFGGFPPGFGPEDIPDPSRLGTFEESKVDWAQADRSEAIAWRAFLKNLLRVRASHIVPIIGQGMLGGTVVNSPQRCLFVDWRHDGGALHMRANLSEDRVELVPVPGVEVYPARSLQRSASIDGFTVRVWKATSGN